MTTPSMAGSSGTNNGLGLASIVAWAIEAIHATAKRWRGRETERQRDKKKQAVRRHTDLEVYSRAFPAEERYSLTDQIRRSSRSVCANLAEAWRKRRYEAAFISKLGDSEAEAGRNGDSEGETGRMWERLRAPGGRGFRVIP